ncbi:hypothetical protein [Neisseria polysaccharea]|uniref:Uncharacterized protein n=1 Tax=Neisseria polysaccharea TaxID=489 RepID=A0ABV1JLT7_NEIPO|nr:hypothetical protein [Neisseria polysaccharea]
MPSEALSSLRRHFAYWRLSRHTQQYRSDILPPKCPSAFRIIKITVSSFDSSRTARFTRLKKCRLKHVQTASA